MKNVSLIGAVPVITDLSIIPSAIPKGGKISIKAKGEIR